MHRSQCGSQTENIFATAIAVDLSWIGAEKTHRRLPFSPATRINATIALIHGVQGEAGCHAAEEEPWKTEACKANARERLLPHLRGIARYVGHAAYVIALAVMCLHCCMVFDGGDLLYVCGCRCRAFLRLAALTASLADFARDLAQQLEESPLGQLKTRRRAFLSGEVPNDLTMPELEEYLWNELNVSEVVRMQSDVCQT